MLLSFLFATAIAALAAPRPSRSSVSDYPTAELAGGTYYGLHKPAYNQDEFLGMPYAQAPVGNLRLSPPRPVDDTWDSPRNATEYSPLCFGYGSDTWALGNYVSEDCLTINVIRPHGMPPDAQLPVAVWVHGGGLQNGGSSDPRYNLTFVVERSVKMGTPIIAANFNYRMHAWGFLWSSKIAEAGVGNLGLRDQRLALEWVQENIASFGGNPEMVTLWGGSAGARTVGAQLLAYNGRDDRLFRAAIMQSGTALESAFDDVVEDDSGDAAQAFYDEIVEKTGCSGSGDTLQCLREVETWTLSEIFNSTKSPGFSSVVDGDFLMEKPADLLRVGNFVHVPVLLGANFDEGTEWAEKGIDTDEQWAEHLASEGANNRTIEALSALYLDIPAAGVPASLDGRPSGDLAKYGQQWKRVAAYTGDKRQHAPRRWWAQQWAAHNLTTYSYHFNVLVNGFDAARGASHFQEVALVFDNVQGLGYDTPVAENPFEGMPETYTKLADSMSAMWVSFINDMDPNYSGATCIHWPVYTLDEPRNIVFDVNVSSLAYVELDVYRIEQVEYLSNRFWGGNVESGDE